jgi:hypothetical protein
MADGVTEASFMNEWHTKYAGTVIDRTNKKLKATSTASTSTSKASVFS